MKTMQHRKQELAEKKLKEREIANALHEHEGISLESPTPIGRRYSDIQKADVEWLWGGFLAKGKITMLAGKAGIGKSFLMAYLASRVSSGLPFYDGQAAEKAGVVLCTVEDSAEDTLIARLEDAQADLSRVVDLSTTRNEKASLHGASLEQKFQLPRDMGQLEKAIAASSAALVVIDPLSGSMEKFEHNEFVRGEILGPLTKIAEQYQCAVLLINHFRKGRYNEENFHTALAGARAWVEGCRLAFVAVPDKSYDGAIALMCIKCNIGKVPPVKRYRIIEDELGRVHVQFITDYTAIIPSRVIKGGDVRKAILLFMALNAHVPVSAQIILNHVKLGGNMLPPSSIRCELHRLYEDGYLVKVAYGYYEIKDELKAAAQAEAATYLNSKRGLPSPKP